MEGERDRTKNQPLKLDWERLLSSDSDGDDRFEPVVIVKSKPIAAAAKNSAAMAANEAAVEQLHDHELLERIRSTRRTIFSMQRTLGDKGEKLRSSLRRLEDEYERRKHRLVETIELEDSDGLKKAARPINSNSTDSRSGVFCELDPPSGNGHSKNLRGEDTTSQDRKDSSFASNFFNRMNGNPECRKSNAFCREVSLLGPCNQQKMRTDEELLQKRRRDDRSSSRHSPSKRRNSLYHEAGKRVISNGTEKGRAASILSQESREKNVNFYEKGKDPLPVSNSSNRRLGKGQTIVLEDEEEPQPIEILVEKPHESMKDVTIYYPSRSDPEAVEISYSDFDCLAPQAYLRSNIMNFYIRYLQKHVSPTSTVMPNCHFFNTYFYDKLKEVLSHRPSSRDEFFVKFRRWWKGVNIFHKDYILIPINEDVHWSLVIICIPEKEELSGPIVLHLDSLGLHSSRSVFQNIRSFLIEEWMHLCRDGSYSDLPFADSIWERFSHKIMNNRIAVPQQKNDYDCGLFVLYFMERFVEDARGRLKKKDLDMFGKQWFKPEEASGLRVKLNKLLIEEFKNARATESPSPSQCDTSLQTSNRTNVNGTETL